MKNVETAPIFTAIINQITEDYIYIDSLMVNYPRPTYKTELVHDFNIVCTRYSVTCEVGGTKSVL